MSFTVTKWAIPPIAKIPEALSAVADSRVKLFENMAKVSSSDLRKEYTVEWEEDVYSSNDNASYWQGYMGYPLIAVLMLQGKIKYKKVIAELFKGINWKELNTKYKNEYAKVVTLILEDMKNSGVDIVSVNQEIESIYEQIKTLNIRRRKSVSPPPRSS
jgi:hypothetical protein